MKNIVGTLFRVSIFSSVFLFLLTLTGCINFAGSCSSQEVKRIPSPSSSLDAIITEGGCGATTSVITRIYIVPAGTTFDDKTEAFSDSRELLRAGAHSLDDFTFSWEGGESFSIGYHPMRIYAFTNFGQVLRPDGSRTEFEVRLTSLEKRKNQ